ncbi:helix-turn-helix domain-containing protein [Metabacillus litoralis]|jgi:two-component system, response regulator YesN|uniref:helix-turn-helix domain-containing protein n=1 Tax=Metabacillus litoralis TaxID=152268 RepID=UPI00203DB46D|nr:helix-turn-helix domain-containing protein [Metabacillus litoralis]
MYIAIHSGLTVIIENITRRNGDIMEEKDKFDYSGFHKKCMILNTVTKMDVRLIDKDGNAVLQLVNHTIPAVLQNFDNEFLNINNTLRKNLSINYYYFINSYGLEYIAAGLWKNSSFYGFILIGPFLSSIPTIDFISDIISTNKLPVSERKQLQQFYKSLSVIGSNDSNSIGELLVNLCTYNHIDSQLITSEIPIQQQNKAQRKTTIAESNDIIEFRYHYEKKLMNAITKGDKEEIARISKETNSVLNLSDRIPESPIRSAKNLLLVLNTLCRFAAEKGGIHPIHIHNVSEKFALLIERAPNLPHLKKLGVVMIHEYCDVVNQFSTRNYSPIVKKAVNYIELNLEESLTLKEISAIIHVNPSHLSRKFKNETKMNMIDYINQKRVEEAKLYLQRGNSSITEIAFMVGFNDLNYFSRVFKKFTSLTPSQYIKSEND